MKTILMPYKPKEINQILNGEKTLDLRNFKIDTPFKILLYCTENTKDWYIKTEIQGNTIHLIESGNEMFILQNTGKIIGEFIVNKIGKISWERLLDNINIPKSACLTLSEFISDCIKKDAYGWHIDELKVYSQPKDLDNYRKQCIMPKMPYCPSCKFGSVEYSEDEVETYADTYGASCEWHCRNFIKTPIKSYVFVEERDNL